MDDHHSGLFGVLNVCKPAGVTSRDVVNVVQRLVRPVKTGHAGTLDPMATGVLLVCVGPATRLVSLLQQAPKTYLAEFRFGQTSDTDDSTGQVTEVPDAVVPDRARIEAVLPEFCGVISQKPPAWSAVKVNGRRAYALARQGREPDLRPRPVRIDSIDITEYDWPRLSVQVRCGSGTYIRSLARDLGDRLGCGGLMSGLTRVRIGDFRIDDAVHPDQLSEDTVREHLCPAIDVVSFVSQYRCTEAERKIVARGGSFDLDRSRLIRRRLLPDRPGDAEQIKKTPPLALTSEAGDELLALAEIRRQGRRIQPRAVFIQPTR